MTSIDLLDKEPAMSLSTVEIAKARDTTNTILDELLLDACVFELEPRDDVWVLTIECAQLKASA
jgi:hypothetical protein